MGLLDVDDLARLGAVIDHVQDGLVACDQSGRFLVWNRAAEEMLGKPLEIDPEDWSHHFGLYCPHRMRLLQLSELPLWRCLEGMQPIEQAIWMVNPQRPQGVWLEVQAKPWMSPCGELLGAMAAFRDVTDSRWAALTTRLLGALYLSLDYAIIGFDSLGMIVSWNPGAEKLWGYRQDEILGQPAMVLMPPSRLMELAILNHLLRANLPIPRVETQIMRKDGGLVPVARSISPWRDEVDSYAGGVAVLSDITPRKKVEEKLRKGREQLRELSARIERAKEDELLRISRELHDELGQQLTGLRLDLAWLEAKLGEVHPELGDRVESMARLVDETLKQVRRLSSEMRPPLLDDLGLPSAITHWAQQLRSRGALAVLVEVQANLTHVRPESALAIYRILQEASTNVLRHSGAQNLWLQAFTEEENLVVSIRDDGRGFAHRDPPSPGATSSLGLLGMRERALLWGGELEIDSRPGGGTRVTMRLPWARIAREIPLPRSKGGLGPPRG